MKEPKGAGQFDWSIREPRLGWTREKQRATDKSRRSKTMTVFEELMLLLPSLKQSPIKATQMGILSEALNYISSFHANTNEVPPPTLFNEEGCGWDDIIGQTVQEMWFVVNLQGTIAYVSDYSQEVLGLANSSLIGVNLFSLVKPDDVRNVDKLLHDTWNTYECHQEKQRVIQLYGTHRVVAIELRASALRHSRDPHVLLRGSPVFPLALNTVSANDKLAGLLMIKLTVDGYWLYGSPNCVEYLGINSSEMIGDTPCMHVHRDDLPQLFAVQEKGKECFKNGVSEGRLTTVAYRLYNKHLNSYIRVMSDVRLDRIVAGKNHYDCFVLWTWKCFPCVLDHFSENKNKNKLLNNEYDAPYFEISYELLLAQQENLDLKRQLQIQKLHSLHVGKIAGGESSKFSRECRDMASLPPLSNTISHLKYQ